jgi:hypothetical protein
MEMINLSVSMFLMFLMLLIKITTVCGWSIAPTRIIGISMVDLIISLANKITIRMGGEN